MAKDDEYPFRPRLGKPRARGGRGAKRFINRVLRAASLSGPKFSLGGSRQSGSSGSWKWRGSVASRFASSRDAGRPSYRMRRVVVKTRIVKLAGPGKDAARLHLKYIQRDGVDQDGEPGRLYNARSHEADGDAFRDRAQGDRHQFRFIVSPEDAEQLEDMPGYTRALMSQMERDLGTRLEWVAVDHHNTGHPHTHIVLRGVDQNGDDLVIARDYISHGMRERARELATLELGLRTDHEIQTNLKQEIDQERFTSIDRDMLRDADDGMIDLRRKHGSEYERFKHALRARRLGRLERMGLTQEMKPGVWALSGQLEDILRRAGERGDIIKTMHRELVRTGVERGAANYAIFDPLEAKDQSLVGRVVSKGLSDELNNGLYVIVDGVDGKAHYVDLGQRPNVEDIAPGAIVEITARLGVAKAADKTIADIAARNGGLYCIDAHLAHDPDSSKTHAQAHVRRLELMRRAGVVTRFPNGDWDIPSDFERRAAGYEQTQTRREPVALKIQSAFRLEEQINADGATWLDKQLVGRAPVSIKRAGFGKQVEAALEKRSKHLIGAGLAERAGDGIKYRKNLLTTLRYQELRRLGAKLAEESGIPYREAGDGQLVSGTYRRAVNLMSGKFAFIEKSHEFTLVPWRDVLERNRGKHVEGVIKGQSISWNLGRKRGPEIG